MADDALERAREGEFGVWATHVGQVLKLTGPMALTYDDVAAALERALGKPVAHCGSMSRHCARN